ncbi:hypothetical protein JW992_16290, partial [candidate division KSB1 bacterium]|nr:hypothetical protein [candidate division KSB1 bacterium]
MNKSLKTLLLIALVGMVAAWVGCDIFEPVDSESAANQPPDTRIVAAPRTDADFSYFMPISWLGSDDDGYVVEYVVTVDGVTFETTKTDSTFKFSAANQDEQHSISVAAVDDDGAIDSTPANLTFTAVNQEPDTEIRLDDDPPAGATFGRAQRFYIDAIDPDNGPEFSYRWKLNEDGSWSDWSTQRYVDFLEANPLPLGQQTFIAQARDAAMAVDETPASFNFVVSAEVKPIAVLNTSINSLPFYPDNSAFYFAGDSNKVRLSWEVDASAYYGHYQAAKIKIDDQPESDWLTRQDTLFADLSAGEHTFVLKVKDTGGIESDPVVFDFNLVQPTFDQGVMVVDEANGRFAKDANVDQFYTDLITGLGMNVYLYDIQAETMSPTPGKGIGSYHTVIWQSDETFAITLQTQTRLLSEYMRLGGNLWVTGWKVINGLAGATPANFNPEAGGAPANAAFVWDYFKIASTRQTPAVP